MSYRIFLLVKKCLFSHLNYYLRIWGPSKPVIVRLLPYTRTVTLVHPHSQLLNAVSKFTVPGMRPFWFSGREGRTFSHPNSAVNPIFYLDIVRGMPVPRPVNVWLEHDKKFRKQMIFLKADEKKAKPLLQGAMFCAVYQLRFQGKRNRSWESRRLFQI